MGNNVKNHDITGEKEDTSHQHKDIKKLSQLKSNCAYFAFSDYYVIELAKRRSPFKKDEGRLYEDIERRLRVALLFFDKIIIHSADIIRDQKVYEILNKYRTFIKEEIIEFIYSSSIKTINYDVIINYVKRKNNDGEKGLIEFIDKTEFAKNVIELLNTSPNIVHRDYNIPSKEQFIKLVKDDLVEHKTFSNNDPINLYQILFNFDEKGVKIQKEKAKSFKEKIDSIAAGEQYSRQHILNDFIEILGEPVDCLVQQPSNGRKKSNESHYAVTKLHYSLVEERLCLLYANLNAHKHFIIDFHYEREKHSPFKVNTLETYFSLFTKRSISAIMWLSPTVIASVRKSKEWKWFVADYFLSYEQWRSQQYTDIMNVRKEIFPINSIDNYSELSKILGCK